MQNVKKITLLSIITLFCSTLYVRAEVVLSTTEEIVKLYCKDAGQIVQCIGRSASECPYIIRPIVEMCQPVVQNNLIDNEAAVFSKCFSDEFSRKYIDQLQYRPGCTEPIYHPDAIKPPPPEFAVQGTPFPFGEPSENGLVE